MKKAKKQWCVKYKVSSFSTAQTKLFFENESAAKEIYKKAQNIFATVEMGEEERQSTDNSVFIIENC